MNINLNYIKKKVFLTEDFVPWEHEQFSKRKIISATLSTLSEPPENIFTRSLFTDVEELGISFMVFGKRPKWCYCNMC